MRSRLLAAVACLLLIACGDDDGPGTGDGGDGDGGNDGGGRRDSASGPADACIPSEQLDVLFVIDNSGSMAEEQSRLGSAFHELISQLSTLPGGLPDIHIGVVSSDMGTTPFTVTGCTASGGNKGILHAPAGTCVGAPSGRFISHSSSGQNYPGTLEAAFTCLAAVGITGCGLEQHLQSMKRALDGSNPENAGFLRPGAYLAIIILADEDDCSAKPGGLLYDPNPGTLGVLSSYRCTRYGVQCTPDTPDSVGVKDQCVSREDSTLVESVQTYVDFLTTLKGAPKVSVFTIVGNTTPFEIFLDAQSHLALEASCNAPGDTTGAAPAVRLDQLARAFPHNAFTSICASDFAPALAGAGLQLASLLAQCK